MSLKLSIIIPCYNCEKTLREAVDSCYVQGFKEAEFEIVMVDDCSSDDTRKLMQTLSKEHQNIRLFYHEKNQGGGATRNTAVEKTSAEVIFCLDSDDILPVGTLRKMFDYRQNNNCDGVGVHYSINFRGTDLTDINHLVTMAYAGEVIPFESLFQKNQMMCSLYQVFMFTKQAFTKAGGYPTEHGFDTQGFAWRFLGAGLIAHTVPDTFYLLRVNFHESYYLREQNQGLINFNWQKILAEYPDVFTDSTRKFIEKFACADVSRNLFAELCQLDLDKILKPNLKEYLGKNNTTKINLSTVIPTRRNSIKGLYQRLRKRI